ncbi:MAG: S-layer homology domain-containing protein [Ruminococcaceae bacterium]|nr:S-layer homology domain-containing protein [Oscillospiraceae bacterium]
MNWHLSALCLVLLLLLGSVSVLAMGNESEDGEDTQTEETEETEAESEETEETGETEGGVGAEELEQSGETDEEPLPFSNELSGKWYACAVAEAYQNGWIDAVTDSETGELRMDAESPVTRGEAIDSIWRMMGRPASSLRIGYVDMDARNPYLSAIDWAGERRVALGVGDGRFGWSDTLTREQLAVMLYRCAHVKGMGFAGTWMLLLDTLDRDQVSDWAYEGVCWLYLNGVMRGGDRMYLPKSEVTRAELAAVLTRFAALSAE